MTGVSFVDWFARRTASGPDRVALEFEGSSLTYGQLLHDSTRLAAGLRRLGVRSGDRIAYLAGNHPQFFVLVLAASRIGAIVVPLNARFTPSESRLILEDVGAMAIVTDEIRSDVADEAAGPDLIRLAVGGAVGRFSSVESVFEDPEGDGPASVDPIHPVMILYTSGATGRPKGAVITGDTLWGTAINCLIECDFRRDDRLLLISPTSHVAVWPWALCTWLKGGTVVLAPAFDIDQFFDLVEHHGITSWGAVTPLLEMIAASPRFESAPLGSLRWIVCGGAQLAAAPRDKFLARGIDIRRAYGLTEAGAMVAVMPTELSALETTASGHPMVLTDVHIDPLNGFGPGTGEIMVRGPNVIGGYWGADPGDQGERAWIRSGDIGRLDDLGLLHIEGRLKEMIKTGGENVFAAEVERVLERHPSLRELAVVGLPDERWGETVVAAVVLHDGRSIELEELREFGGRDLARFKLPTRIEVFTDLPRNAVGKVLKHEIVAGLSAPPD